MTKADIRDQIAAQKKKLNFQTLEKMSADVVCKIQSLEVFRAAKSVGAYMPLPCEVDISPLFQALEKTFFIPAFDETSGGYRLARMTTELKKGHFGILEPVAPAFAAENELDLILVPGVAFDQMGNRIGRGGGFYDRLLPQYQTIRAGICYDFQCLGCLPTEKHDTPMNFIVTEIQILKIAMNS